MSKRYEMKVELFAPAMELLHALSDVHGMTQKAIIARLFEFFTVQKENIQAAILSEASPKERESTARMILEDMAGKG